jgi:hypothetical protein
MPASEREEKPREGKGRHSALPLLDDWVEQFEHEKSMPRRMIVANVVIQSSVGIQQRVKVH